MGDGRWPRWPEGRPPGPSPGLRGRCHLKMRPSKRRDRRAYSVDRHILFTTEPSASQGTYTPPPNYLPYLVVLHACICMTHAAVVRRCGTAAGNTTRSVSTRNAAAIPKPRLEISATQGGGGGTMGLGPWIPHFSSEGAARAAPCKMYITSCTYTTQWCWDSVWSRSRACRERPTSRRINEPRRLCETKGVSSTSRPTASGLAINRWCQFGDFD